MATTEPDQTLPDKSGKLDKKQDFIELRAKGHSYTKIARRLKVSKNTLVAWNKELEEEVSRARAMELEALLERYWLQKEGRIKILGDQMQALRKELRTRDLSDVSTDKLLDLLLKYEDRLREEALEPIDSSREPADNLPETISRGLQDLYRLYTMGLVTDSQVKQGIGVATLILKANEQMAIEDRLLALELTTKGYQQS